MSRLDLPSSQRSCSLPSCLRKVLPTKGTILANLCWMPWVASAPPAPESQAPSHVNAALWPDTRPNTLLKRQQHPWSPKKRGEKNLWKRDSRGNLFGWRCFVRGSREPSPADSGWDLESGKLLKKGWSFVQVSPGWETFSQRLGPALYNAWSNRQHCHHCADELPNPSGSLSIPTACSVPAGSLCSYTLSLSHGDRLRRVLRGS